MTMSPMTFVPPENSSAFVDLQPPLLPPPPLPVERLPDPLG